MNNENMNKIIESLQANPYNAYRFLLKEEYNKVLDNETYDVLYKSLPIAFIKKELYSFAYSYTKKMEIKEKEVYKVQLFEILKLEVLYSDKENYIKEDTSLIENKDDLFEHIKNISSYNNIIEVIAEYKDEHTLNLSKTKDLKEGIDDSCELKIHIEKDTTTLKVNKHNKKRK